MKLIIFFFVVSNMSWSDILLDKCQFVCENDHYEENSGFYLTKNDTCVCTYTRDDDSIHDREERSEEMLDERDLDTDHGMTSLKKEDE